MPGMETPLPRSGRKGAKPTSPSTCLRLSVSLSLSLTSSLCRASLSLPPAPCPRAGGGRGGKGLGAWPCDLTRTRSFPPALLQAVEETACRAGWRSGHGDPAGTVATRLGRAAAGLAARMAPRYVGRGWVAGGQAGQRPPVLSLWRGCGGNQAPEAQHGPWQGAVWLWAGEGPSLGSGS